LAGTQLWPAELGSYVVVHPLHKGAINPLAIGESVVVEDPDGPNLRAQVRWQHDGMWDWDWDCD
jgi:hypothetical protein